MKRPLIEKFETNAEGVVFAVVILTPDVDAGHFMAEEEPATVTDFVRRLLAR